MQRNKCAGRFVDSGPDYCNNIQVQALTADTDRCTVSAHMQNKEQRTKQPVTHRQNILCHDGSI